MADDYAGTSDGALAAQADMNRAELRRMRWVATSLLGTMLALLVATAAYESAYPLLRWVRAFAEAAAIGAIADWYAVVAMFRRPLGLPIPHTAIIPENKDRIAESLANFVEQNFLTPENVMGKLAEHDAARAVAEWLAEPGNSRPLAREICEAIPPILEALEDEDVRRFFDDTVIAQLSTLDVSRIAGSVLALLTERDRHQALLDRALSALETWLTAHQGLIKEKFSEASKYTPDFMDRYIVDKFISGIVALLHEIAANPRHELRQQFDQAIREFVHQLNTAPDFRQRGASLVGDIIDHLKKDNYYRNLWRDIRLLIQADVASDRSMIRRHVESALVTLGRGLLNQPPLQGKLNAWWLDAAEKMVLRFRHEISSLIRDVVKSWDADEVARKVELEIGKDLQYIRINGTLVGGAVGVALHVITTTLAV
jgi:uncharacterized membrane-anchored protein YjiN (DUF445 family)